MKNVKPYLIFAGNCEEALNFYAESLGGEIAMLQTFADAPFDVPEEAEGKVFNSLFQAGDINFMASDDMPPYKTTVGTNFAMFVTFSDATEHESAYTKLSEGGNATMPLDGGFGMLTDKYGIQWMLALDKK